MTHSAAGRTLTTKGGYPVQVSRRLHGDVRYLGRESASGTVRKKEEKEQKDALLGTIVVAQWICFVLGFVCVALGTWGICMKPGQDALPTYIAWLGLLYMPALRVTAAACLGMGMVLIRRGWTHL